MRIYSLSGLLIFAVQIIMATTFTQVSHYSEKDGLSEINVTCIHQDKKGRMWFGTYDGLNMYNGYKFKTYKKNASNLLGLQDYRVDAIKEDCFGNLWILTYNGCVYKFVPQTEKFIQYPQKDEKFKNINPRFDKIYCSPDGNVWLSGKQEGCFKIRETAPGNEDEILHFDKLNGLLTTSSVNNILTDSKKNTWVLSSNGLNLFRRKSILPEKFFFDNTNGGFYSISENYNHVWFGGDKGKVCIYDLQRDKFDFVSVPSHSPVIGVFQYSGGEAIIITSGDGFYIYNIDQKTTTSYNTHSGRGVLSNDIYSYYVDQNNNIWLETANPDVALFDTKNRKLTNFTVQTPFPKQKIPLHFFVVEDKKGTIWVHPRFGGLSLYNKATNKLEYKSEIFDSNNQKFSNVVHSAYIDRQGNLWLSPYSHSLKKIVTVQSPFRFRKVKEGEYASASNEVRSIFQDKQNRYWIATKNGMINIYDQNHLKTGHLTTAGSIGNGTPMLINAYCIFEDNKSVLWIGSKGQGLFRLATKDKNSYTITNYRYDPDDINSISSDNVYSIMQDNFNRIWLATYGGGICCITNKGSGTSFISSRNSFRNYPSEKCNKARFITEDKNGLIYVGTTAGLIVFKNPAAITDKLGFKHEVYNPGEEGTLSGNDVHNVLPASDGKLYLAIFGGGLNVLNKQFNLNGKNDFESFLVEAGAPSNIFYTLREDKNSNIWFSTETTIGKFSPKNKLFETYKPFNSNAYIFMEAAALLTKEGVMIYGTSDGYLSFDIEQQLKSEYSPKIIFTDFQLFNKKVEPGVEGSPLSENIDYTQELVLNHNQNVFTISFSALDYTDNTNIQYAYMLEGFDNDWNYVQHQNMATYTNLPKGSYVFKVKSTNSDGKWVANERNLKIVKRPSFWESNTGYFFYFLLLLAIIAVSAYVIHKFYLLRANAKLEQKMIHLKLKFFTDISHELRTPLTLISSPVEYVLKTEKLSEKGVRQLSIVQNNIERMMRLITQLLDFRKIQNNKMKLQVESINVKKLLKEIAVNFSAVQHDATIDILAEDDSQPNIVWADKDKFEKIFYNLFSNAFKYSNKAVNVVVNIRQTANNVIVEVTDNGIGIDPDKLKLLFNRFETFADPNDLNNQSTGIGLNLTKELIELHHARIEVESTPGVGSTFRVVFMTGKEHFGSGDNITEKDENNTPDQEAETDEEAVGDTSENLSKPDKQQILIVEDNHELREFLKDILSEKYDVLEAENGVKAHDILATEIPDIIVTDVMMPEMTGIELSKMIKDDIRISHIPIVLLTARTDIDTKVEALKLGVDDYLTKPFSATYLEARIENILSSRKRLQEHYLKTISKGSGKIAELNASRQDEIFIQRIIQYIDDNIGNAELTIDDIAASLAMGRSTFFKKLKSMIGISPVEFLKEYRIQRAAELVISTEYNFTEIAYQVGISDLSYFSRCFKQKYGISPREYKEKNQTK